MKTNYLQPNYLKSLISSDEDFVSIVENLISNDSTTSLNEKDYALAVISACIGSNGLDLFKKLIAQVLKEKVLDVLELREIVYQSQAFIGLTQSYSFVKELSKYLGKNEIKVPKNNKKAITDDDKRNIVGQKLQETLFGSLQQNSSNEKLNALIKANCYGDFFSRKNLSLRLRELSAFAILCSMDNCNSQLQAHVRANYVVGNEYTDLINVITAIVPFIGYVKAANAVKILDEVKVVETTPSKAENKVETKATEEKAEVKDTDAKAETAPKAEVKTEVKTETKEASVTTPKATSSIKHLNQKITPNKANKKKRH